MTEEEINKLAEQRYPITSDMCKVKRQQAEAMQLIFKQRLKEQLLQTNDTAATLNI